MHPSPAPAAAPHPGAGTPPGAETTPPDLLTVGRIVAAQGLQGELRVLPLSDFPERFTSPGSRWLRRRQGTPRTVELRHGRPLPGKDLYVVRLAGVNDRTAAEALVGEDLLVDAADRPPLEPGEFHVLDLVNLEVRLLPAGTPVGRIRDLIHGGNDLLEVELTEGRRVLIPFVDAIVPEVQIEAGWVGITPPPGLLEL